MVKQPSQDWAARPNAPVLAAMLLGALSTLASFGPWPASAHFPGAGPSVELSRHPSVPGATWRLSCGEAVLEAPASGLPGADVLGLLGALLQALSSSSDPLRALALPDVWAFSRLWSACARWLPRPVELGGDLAAELASLAGPLSWRLVAQCCVDYPDGVSRDVLQRLFRATLPGGAVAFAQHDLSLGRATALSSDGRCWEVDATQLYSALPLAF